ncbi:MAG TPA: leucine-rich repeat protein [Candidatus Sulfotelmatobacter sp.]|nr:leucine-rich repeat protein [Candidatus Sulfotelmatobacter sp.]
MKNLFQKIFTVLAVLASVHQTNAAVSFTITPTAISNTYNGIITLQITGLSDGDTVVVRKFLDANTNGVVDAGDILWQEFQMTDGQASVFTNGTTSITNFNVASDTDGSANGAITAKLIPAQDFAQLVVGKYLFELWSPAGHFTPITNTFAVTNFPFAQSVSGNVVNNGTNVPNAVVFLFQPTPGGGQNPQYGAVANNSGAYRVAAPTGAYLLAAIKTNFVANLNASPNVVLNTGTTITTNVPLTNATESISGSVVDASSDAGVAGYLVPLESDDGLLAVAFTDTNGNFGAGVTSDHWKVDNNSDSLLIKGYLTVQNNINVNTTTGSVSGVTESLTKETAVFYGTVEDPSGNPLTGVNVYTADNNDLYQSDGVAFTNGYYVASAVGGGGDLWQVQYDQRGPANYIYSQPAIDQNNGTNINAGQAIQVNLTGVLATNEITGTVYFDGSPVAGVGVYASATTNDVNFNNYVDTADDGTYSLNVANGAWTVGVNCNGGSDSLENIIGSGFDCPNSVTVGVNNSNVVVNFTVPPVGSDDEFYGYVSDSNGNPIAGVDVYASDGSATYTNTTDSTGYYSFFVTDGDWELSVNCGQLQAKNPNYQCTGTEETYICCGDSSELDFVIPIDGASGYFRYSEANNEVTITSYTGPGGAVSIPGAINSLPVTTIGYDALGSSSVTGVTIPDSVTIIEQYAFEDASLSSVIIPNSVTYIGDSAFAYCYDLASITLGTNVATIGDSAFYSCSSLATITIPASATTVYNDAFIGCSSLSAINAASGNPAYASVGGVLFNNSLTSLLIYPEGNPATTYTVPAGVTSIGANAFYSCDSLVSVTIGGGVNSIGPAAFAYASLASLYFLGSAPATDPTAFEGNNDSGYIDATIYYLQGATGWTSPFQGLPAVMLSEQQSGVPQLVLIPYSGNAILTWPTNDTGFALQSSTNLARPSEWINVSLSPIIIGGQNVIIVPASGRQQFFRLKH